MKRFRPSKPGRTPVTDRLTPVATEAAPQWIAEMQAHHLKHGYYRPSDFDRGPGDPLKAVEVVLTPGPLVALDDEDMPPRPAFI